MPRVRLRWVIALSLAACTGSRDKLLADLQSARPEERALAVKKLAEQGKPDDLVLFTRAAKDPVAIVRGEAVAALASSQDQRVVDLLGELLADADEGVQAKAAAALAELKSDKSKAYLTNQYARRGRDTRIAIVRALKSANVPGPMAGVIAAEAKGLWDRNLNALTAGALPERVAAAEELGKSGKPEAVTKLLPLLKDSQVILAAAAVRGLGFAGDPRTAEPISNLLKENFPQLRDAACESLLRLQDVKPLAKLLEVAVEKSAASPQATAAILALPKGGEVDKALCQVALDGGAGESLAAGREMRRRGGCALEPILDRLSKPPSVASGLQALIGLGPTGKAALPKILPTLASTDAQVRRLALDALAELGDASAVPAVQKVFEQEAKSVEGMRAKWITAALPKEPTPGFGAAGGRPDEQESRAKREDLLRRAQQVNAQKEQATQRVFLNRRAPAELVDDVSPEQLGLLAAAVHALGALKAPDAQATLERFAGDGSRVLRKAAYTGLAALGGKAIPLAAAGLLDEEPEVQGAVADALAASGDDGKRAVAELLPRLGGERIRLLDALRAHGATQGSVDALVSVLREGGAEAAVAAQILGTLKAQAAAPELMRLLEDPNAVGRRELLVSLGQVGDAKAAELVARDLYHDSPEVRAAAAEALARVGSPAQAEALDALKGDYFRRVRESAELALSKIGGVGGAEPPK